MLTGYDNWLTLYEGIALVATSTGTIRCVIDNVAYGIQTASARTGIDTMFVDTCFDIRTIGINGAFGSTVWWIAIIIRQTFTVSNTILIIALSKMTAR